MRAIGLYVFDRLCGIIPSSLASKLCGWTAMRPCPLCVWPGWYLGAGQLQMWIPILVRRMLWRWFSSRCLNDTFILRWHNEIKILAYPKVETCRSLFITGYYEPNEFCFLKNILKPGMVFIDIGANLGLYSLFASNLVGDEGTVLAIEPSERDFERLKANIKLNQCANVRPIMQAISNNSSERELLIADEEHSGHNTFGDFAYAGVQREGKQVVRTVTVDELVQKERLNRVDVIKIDVEGHELFVLEGAKETLKRFRPILLVEIADRALIHQGCNSSQVLNLLRQHGYQIYLFSKKTGLPVPLKEKIDYFDSENILAIHQLSKVRLSGYA